jgi:ElaB/YqjD/DUF883 family membrane-anchored ribosome-binding protein
MNIHSNTPISSLPNVARQAAGEMSDSLSQEANRFGELARSWWQRNADVVRDAAGTVRDEAAAMGSRTRLYVKDEPVKSVLVAAAVGALVTGLLMLMMKRDR